MRTFIDLEEAWRITGESLRTMPVETVSLDSALGRTLAGDVTCDTDVPPFDNSAMDGYALRSTDLAAPGTVLPVDGRIRAGQWPDTPVREGACRGITTGSPMPEGADAVVPVEETTDLGDGTIRFDAVTRAGRHVRHAGRDVRRGETVVGTGTVITPPVVGILAMTGTTAVRVHRVPSVAVVTTGDELVPPGSVPAAGQIRNSNGPALAAQARSAGADPAVVLHAADDTRSTGEAIRRARVCDVLVFSGGVSMGTHDLVREGLEEAGMTTLYWKVKQRPGKPLLYGMLDGRPVFGLPGNPVSSSICFDQHVRPALALMLGRRGARRRRYPAVLDEAISKPADLHVFARGIVRPGDDGRLRVRPTGPQGSNIFTSVLRANALVHLPAGLEDAPAGLEVEIEWLMW